MTQVPSNPMFYEPPDVLDCPKCGSLRILDDYVCADCEHQLPGWEEEDPGALFDELREEGRL